MNDGMISVYLWIQRQTQEKLTVRLMYSRISLADKKEIQVIISYCDFLRYLLSWPRFASSMTSITLSVLQTPINRTMNSLLRFAINFASLINSACKQPSLHTLYIKQVITNSNQQLDNTQQIAHLCHTQYRPLGEASEAPILGLVSKGGIIFMQVKNGKLVKLLPSNVIL